MDPDIEEEITEHPWGPDELQEMQNTGMRPTA
jgi:hypothetical protein